MRRYLVAILAGMAFSLLAPSSGSWAPPRAGDAWTARAAPPATIAGPRKLLDDGPTLRGLAVESEYDALHVPDAGDLNPRSQLTIELWVKRRPGSGCGSLVSKGRAAGYWLGICDGRLSFSAGGPGAGGSLVIPEGRWTHVAATFDGANLRLYVNGTLDRGVALAQDELGGSPGDLVIGADNVPGSFFFGWIDHVRLWSMVRTEAELRAGRLDTLPPQAGLVAQWPLNGHARDIVGHHDGYAASGHFNADGVLPRDLTVPKAAGAVVLDGRCDPLEYGVAERVVIEGVEPVVAYLQVAGENIYVCVGDMPRSATSAATVAVYLDRNLSRDSRSQPGDDRFSLKQATNAIVEEGDGQGGWRAVTLATGSWEAGRTSSNERWSTELRLARSLLEPPRDPQDPYGAGLAVALLGATGGDGYWPVGAAGSSPATWAAAELAESLMGAPRITFSGRVERMTADGRAEGLAGATVQLFLADETTLRLADVVQTEGDGAWELGYRGALPDRFIARELDPRGTTSVAAVDPTSGIAAGANLLVYDWDEDAPAVDRRYAGVLFVDALTPAASDPVDRHYLIVYGPPVTAEDLAPIVQAKRAQGFQVTWRSTLDLERDGGGRDLAEKVHRWLKAMWEGHEDEPIYALLVGRGDVIPFRDIGWLDNDHRDPARPSYRPAWPTDWYYADLDSDWDTDQDGYFGEFLGCPPGDTYPATADDEGRRTCPEEGSLAREGPYGALRSAEDDFRAEIAVGRLPLNEPAEVRAALAAWVRAEESGGPEKRRALLAGSLWHYEGQSWFEERRTSVSGGDRFADAWMRAPWDGAKPFGHDTAEALEGSLLPRLSPFMAEVRRLYESTAPGGDAGLSPTRFTPDAPLTPATFAEGWQRGPGFVVAAGRGGPDGLDGARWERDWDGDQQVDQPASPVSCLGQVDPGLTGAPCPELTIESILQAGLPAAAASPPVVVANSGATAAVAWRSQGVDANGNVLQLEYGPAALPGVLAARGRLAAWVGSLSPLRPGALDAFQTDLAIRLLDESLRLGDAHNQAMAALGRASEHDLRSYGTVLFGDPAYAYWGTLADGWGIWPEDGGNRRASGAARASGPAVPERVWMLRDIIAGTPAVIGRHGELVIGGSGRAGRLTGSSALVAQGSLGVGGQASPFAAALSADGVWLAAGTTIYLFDAELRARGEVRLPTGAVATGSPRPAGDGVAWVPTQLGLVRLDGAGRATMASSVGVRGTPAVRPSGELVWSTDAGRVEALWVKPSGEQEQRSLVGVSLGQLTPPAISHQGTVYVGSATGRVHALPEEGAGWSLDAGGPVQLRPAIAEDGTVYVATTARQLVAFGAERRELLWRSTLGAVASAAPTVDAAQVYVVAGQSLLALDRASGHVLWTVPLAGPTDIRSSAVIGPDRTLYVTRADQTLVAVRDASWLAAPSSVRLEPTTGGATVRWRDNSSEETGFRVELCDLEERCRLAGVAAADATQLEVRSLPVEVGQGYLARVQAIGRAGGTTGPGVAGAAEAAGVPQAPDASQSSDLAVSVPVQALPGGPPAPAALVAEPAGSDAVALSWRVDGDLEGLLGFTLVRRDAADVRVVMELGADARSFTDRDLRPEGTYTYELTASGPGGTTAPVRLTATTLRRSLLAPTDVSGAVQAEGVRLQWRERNPNETGVRVERLDPGMARYRAVAQLSAGASRLDDRTDLLPGVYTYRVRSIGDGQDSPWASLTLRVGSVGPGNLYLPVSYRFFRR